MTGGRTDFVLEDFVKEGALWVGLSEGDLTDRDGRRSLPARRMGCRHICPEPAAVLLLLCMDKEWEPELTGYTLAPPCPAPAALGLACLPAARRSPSRSSGTASRCSLLCCWIQALASCCSSCCASCQLFPSLPALFQSGDIGSYTCFTFLIMTVFLLRLSKHYGQASGQASSQWEGDYPRGWGQ